MHLFNWHLTQVSQASPSLVISGDICVQKGPGYGEYVAGKKRGKSPKTRTSSEFQFVQMRVSQVNRSGDTTTVVAFPNRDDLMTIDPRVAAANHVELVKRNVDLSAANHLELVNMDSYFNADKQMALLDSL